MKNGLLGTYRYIKTKLFTASIFFTLAVVLFGALTYVQLPCPICDGTGWIKGVANLEITDIEYELIHHEIVGLECGWDYEQYTYDVKLSVENNTDTPLYGMINLTFHDPSETRTLYIEMDDEPEVAVEQAGGIIAAETIFVKEMAADTEQTIEETIVFDGVSLEAIGAEIHLTKANSAHEFVCPFHGESNKISLTEWLRLRW